MTEIDLWKPEDFRKACDEADVEAQKRLQSTADAAVRHVQSLLQEVAKKHTRSRPSFPLRTSWSALISGDGKAHREKDEHLPANLRCDQPDRVIVEAEIKRQVGKAGWILSPTSLNERSLNKLPPDSLDLTPNEPDATPKKRG